VGIRLSQDGVRRNALQIMALDAVGPSEMAALLPDWDRIDPAIREQLRRDALYAQFADRQEADRRAREDDSVPIPAGFVYRDLPGLSRELQLKLDRLRPVTLGDAGRIEGMTPAALALLLSHLKRQARVAAAR
jgi:tRNA uridine 5-carboxymethylaminomethyl modification enzyme